MVLKKVVSDFKKQLIMSNLIACCGINCAECDARIATINNDDELRKTIAEKWKVEYGNEAITADMIHCTGCNVEGVKIGHCAECEMRVCAHGKVFTTCAECEIFESCEIISGFHAFVPSAKENLLTLRA